MLVYESQINPLHRYLNVEKMICEKWSVPAGFSGFLKHLDSLIRFVRLKIAQNS